MHQYSALFNFLGQIMSNYSFLFALFHNSNQPFFDSNRFVLGYRLNRLDLAWIKSQKHYLPKLSERRCNVKGYFGLTWLTSIFNFLSQKLSRLESNSIFSIILKFPFFPICKKLGLCKENNFLVQEKIFFFRLVCSQVRLDLVLIKIDLGVKGTIGAGNLASRIEGQHLIQIWNNLSVINVMIHVPWR